MKRYITLPNGHACSLPTYIKAWRTLRTAKPDAQIKGWDHFPTEAGSILREIRLGVHDRINRHIPGYGTGRKWRETLAMGHDATSARFEQPEANHPLASSRAERTVYSPIMDRQN